MDVADFMVIRGRFGVCLDVVGRAEVRLSFPCSLVQTPVQLYDWSVSTGPSRGNHG